MLYTGSKRSRRSVSNQREQVSQPVSVAGAVVKPMDYQAIHRKTLLEVLAQAGGIAETAVNVAIITRAGHPTIGAQTNG